MASGQQSGDTTDHWDRLLELQTELFLPYELAFLYANTQWAGAESVLDVGCGNGHYLSRLKAYFPDKRFRGIDRSAAMISIASAMHGAEDLEFVRSDFYEFESRGSFDVILLRLVLQHLRGIDPVLNQAARLLRPAGRLIILEPNPADFCLRPSVPSFTRLLQAIEEVSRAKQTNRAKLADLPLLFANLDGWRVEAFHRGLAPVTASASRLRLLQMFLLWVDILEREYDLTFPFRTIRSELEAWAASGAGYGQVGFQIMVVGTVEVVVFS